MLKFTNFDFYWGSTTDPAGGAYSSVAYSKGAVGAAAPPISSDFKKAAFFRVKGIQSVVCICDK